MLFTVGLVVFVSGLAWLLTWLGVAATWVNLTAFVLLAAGLAAGIVRQRFARR